VNHKDGYRWNNSIDNLEWCTSRENLENAFKRQCIDVLLREARLSTEESIAERITRFIAHALEKWETYESSRAAFFDERIETREPEAFVRKYTKQFIKSWWGTDGESLQTALVWATEYWDGRNLPTLYDDKIEEQKNALEIWARDRAFVCSELRASFQAVVGKESFDSPKDARAYADDNERRLMRAAGGYARTRGYLCDYWNFLTNELVRNVSEKKRKKRSMKQMNRGGKKPRKGGRGLYELYGDLRL
jgi:hypothetical protein